MCGKRERGRRGKGEAEMREGLVEGEGVLDGKTSEKERRKRRK